SASRGTQMRAPIHFAAASRSVTPGNTATMPLPCACPSASAISSKRSGSRSSSQGLYPKIASRGSVNDSSFTAPRTPCTPTMRPSSTRRPPFIASSCLRLLAGFLHQRGDLVRALRALGHPRVQLLDVQHQALVLGTGGTGVEVTQTLDVAAVAGAALVGHHHVVERPALGACARKTNTYHDLSTPNGTAGVDQTTSGHGKRAIVKGGAGFPQHVRKGGQRPGIRPPMPFIAPPICRIKPFMPPRANLPIIFSIWVYCFRRRLTSAGWVPEPRATRARREPFNKSGWRRSFLVIEPMIAIIRF